VFLSEVLTFERDMCTDRAAPEKQSTAVSMYFGLILNYNSWFSINVSIIVTVICGITK
jgi:hypothetical protein